MWYVRTTTAALAALLVAAGTGCQQATQRTPAPKTERSMEQKAETAAPTSTPETTAPQPRPKPKMAWLGTKLKDVVSGKSFAIDDFRGTPVLLESFAVW